MKNKPYPALLGGSHLFNEIKKRTPKSRETIPLMLKLCKSTGILYTVLCKCSRVTKVNLGGKIVFFPHSVMLLYSLFKTFVQCFSAAQFLTYFIYRNNIIIK
jgi:hypothetical protein